MTPPSLYTLLALNRAESLIGNNTISIALTDYNFAGKTFHAPLIRSVPGLNLAFVASCGEEKVKRDLPDVTAITSPEAAVQHPGIDLVVITSPNATHAPLACLALNAGECVVVDRPFVPDMQEARELITLAEEEQRLLLVSHSRRWDDDYLGTRQVTEQGAIGTVRHFESYFDRFCPEARIHWREQNVLGSGLWFDLGPYLTDQAPQLLDLPQSVQGNTVTLHDDVEINDWAHVVLDCPAHKAILRRSMPVVGDSSCFAVHGNKGNVIKARADQQEDQLLMGTASEGTDWGEDSDALVVYDASLQIHFQTTSSGDQHQYYVQIRDALNDQIVNPVPPVEALAVIAILETAVRVAGSGMVQTLGLIDKGCSVLCQSCPLSGYPHISQVTGSSDPFQEKSLLVRNLTLLYPALQHKAPLEISANREEDRKQSDRGEKRAADAVDAATASMDRRSSCATRQGIPSPTFIAISANFTSLTETEVT